MLIESGDLIPVARDAIEIPWTKRKLQILSYLFKGPVNFQTYVYDTNVGDIAQLSTYFNPEKWNESDLNGRFANRATLDEITAATVNSQGPNTTGTAVSPGDGLPGTPASCGAKPKSSSLLPRLMVLAPGSEVATSTEKAPEEVNEDYWSSIRSSSDAFDLGVTPLPLDTPAAKATLKRKDSGVIQGSEKLNEKVFLNCGDPKRAPPSGMLTPPLLTPDNNSCEFSKALFGLELLKKLAQEQVSPANSCTSSRASSRVNSRPVSRQSSLSGCGSGRATPSLLTRTPSLSMPPCLSNMSGVSPLADTPDESSKVGGIPEGLRFLLKRRNSAAARSPLTPPPAFDPAQPPPSLPTRMTFSSGGVKSPFSLGSLQFTTPPPGFSTGIPKLDVALNKIGDGRPDRLLAPWTVPGSMINENEDMTTASKKRPSAFVDEDLSEDSIPLFEVADHDNVAHLALTDDNDDLRAMGIRMKRVRPLVEHSPHGSVVEQFNTDDILDLPASSYFADWKK